MDKWDEAEAKWLHAGTTERWHYTLDKGDLRIEAPKKVIDGTEHAVLPVKSDMKLLHKELLRRFGKDVVIKGTFDNEGDYDVTGEVTKSVN